VSDRKASKEIKTKTDRKELECGGDRQYVVVEGVEKSSGDGGEGG